MTTAMGQDCGRCSGFQHQGCNGIWWSQTKNLSGKLGEEWTMSNSQPEQDDLLSTVDTPHGKRRTIEFTLQNRSDDLMSAAWEHKR